MSWFRRGPSVREKLAVLEAQCAAQQELIETLIATVDDVIDSQAATACDSLRTSIALTRRLFDVERDLILALETVASIGTDVSGITAAQAELMRALKSRAEASSDSLELPPFTETEPDDTLN